MSYQSKIHYAQDTRGWWEISENVAAFKLFKRVTWADLSRYLKTIASFKQKLFFKLWSWNLNFSQKLHFVNFVSLGKAFFKFYGHLLGSIFAFVEATRALFLHIVFEKFHA